MWKAREPSEKLSEGLELKYFNLPHTVIRAKQYFIDFGWKI